MKTSIFENGIFKSLTVGLGFFFWAVVLYLTYVLAKDLIAGKVPNEERPARNLLLIALAGSLLLTAAILFRSPYSASDLSIVPDSVEYTAGAVEFFRTGNFQVRLNDAGHPSRYSPWFSLFCLYPFFRVLGAVETGNAIYGVFVFGLIGAVAAFSLGFRLSRISGAICAVVAFLLIPGTRYFGREIMTEVPSAALGLLMAVTINRAVNGPGFLWFSFIGGLAGFAAAIRPTNAVFLAASLLFLYRRQNSTRTFLTNAVALSWPTALIAALTLWFNSATFGSPFRNGYHYWTSVPYDYRELTFSFDYVWGNLGLVLFNTLVPLIILLAGATTLFRDKSDELTQNLDLENFGRFVEWASYACAGILILYLPYFYSAGRFYLPGEVLVAVIAGGLIGGLLSSADVPADKVAYASCLLALLAFIQRGELIPERRNAIQEAVAKSSDGSVIITGLDPVYAQLTAGPNSWRGFIPVSRRVEYASKLVTPVRIENPDPPPRNWSDHRAPGLKAGGAAEAVPEVALDIMDKLHELVEAQAAIYVETRFMTKLEIDTFKREFVLHELSKDLYLIAANR